MNNEQKNSRSHENRKIEIEKYINVWHTPWFPINLDCSKKNSCVSIFPNNYRLSESRKTKNPNPLINAQYIPKGTYKYCVQSSETVVARLRGPIVVGARHSCPPQINILHVHQEAYP